MLLFYNSIFLRSYGEEKMVLFAAEKNLKILVQIAPHNVIEKIKNKNV